MSLRLLVTGRNGQVGWHLQRTLAPMGEVLAIDIEQVDLTDLDAVSRTVREFAPDVVVNAAAYTAVDKAESEPELARTHQRRRAGDRSPKECARTGALLIHYSTDYVYRRQQSRRRTTRRDPTGPLSVYGHTKLEGDQAIIASGCAHVILRTTWVYDIRGKNFLRTVLRLAREKEELRIVGDQYGAPTWARMLAEVDRASYRRAAWSARAVQRTMARAASFISRRPAKPRGRALRRPSWRITTSCSTGPPRPASSAVSSRPSAWSRSRPSSIQRRRRRPRNSVLSNARIQAAFGIAMPDWRDQLRLAMQDAIR